jgi:hypothetical protein
LSCQRRKSNVRVAAMLDTFYAQWRVRCGAVPILREDQDSPPERLLQAIWQHQRLLRDRLRTLDGRPVRVLHPGFRNVEGGPDFRGAVVQLGDALAQTGDLEVDLRSSGWRAHGHDRNPAFNNVILHVLWESDRPAPNAPPTLLLRQVLDAPLGELSLWLGGETAQALPEEFRGQCCAPLRELSAAQLTGLLQQAAAVRLRSKAAQFQARARQTGWDQALWEGLFRALGYKQNVWPMQRLGELRPRWSLGSAGEAVPTESAPGAAGAGRPPTVAGSRPEIPSPDRSPSTLDPASPPWGSSQTLILQARLLGLSGLLPADLSRNRPGSDSFLRRLWDQWWRERDAFAEDILPRTLWRLHGLRPANHPHRRLALAAGWSAAGALPANLEQWCLREIPKGALPGSLLELLQAEPDEFWSWHWSLRSPRLKKQQLLLGGTRVTDLAVNVILPWLWSRALEGRNEAMQLRLQQRYFAWPAAEDNSLLRLARARLLGNASPRLLRGAAAQQGLIQIVRDFCEHSNSICEACKLPTLVRTFRVEQESSAKGAGRGTETAANFAG